MANDLTKQQREEILPNVTAVRLLYPNDGKEIYNIERHETIRGRVFYRLTGLKGALFVRESLAPISPRQPNALDRAERERDEAVRLLKRARTRMAKLGGKTHDIDAFLAAHPANGGTDDR